MLSRLIDRYLDPSESLLEILFGLIMALTMTAGARLLSNPGDIEPLELAVALVGCNIAWGVIDGVFYLLGSRYNRNRRVEFVRRLQRTSDERQAIALIRDEFGLQDEPETRPQDKETFYRSVLEMLRHAGTARAHFRPDDYVAAGIIVALVSATAAPGLIPLLVMDDNSLALRTANALQVILLFAIGYRWAHYSGASPWRSALVIGLMGIALVLVAVALGG
jgi:hypothetical protein